MDNYISREAVSAYECKHKIKTPFAKIIVGGTPEKPCYDILYFDPADGKCHIGFGSYRLDYVFRWLSEEFEVTEPCDDVAPVRHGWWIESHEHEAFCTCSVCDYPYETCLIGNYCPNCGTKMDLEVDNECL